jgi:predicted MFS family arabinose efflux permease
LADGLRFVRASPPMRGMLKLMVPTILIGAPFIAFVAQMATNVHNGDDKATSLLTTAQGIGAVIAAFSLGAATARWGTRRVLIGATFALGPVLVLYAAAPSLWAAAVGLLLVGVVYGYAFTSFSSVAQQSAPDHMRGRVLAVNSFVLGVFYPIGTLIQGPLADAFSLRRVTAGAGVLLLLWTGLTWRSSVPAGETAEPVSAAG